ncbi:MAG TPA: PEGA domain-containing protein [Methanoregula sp.]|nr:PEGA domain-containing protein [Methanoregula sp.]
MTKKLLTLVLVLALGLIICVPLTSAAGELSGIPLEPGPVIIETTEEPTEEPTLLPTLTRETTEPTAVPTTEKPVTLGGGKGWIDVYCNVDGATVYFDGKSEGTIAGGILSVAVSPTGTPVSSIKVTKPGYNQWTGEPSHMPESGEHVAVYATINPLTTIPTTIPTIPPVTTGQIYAQSSPSGAALYLNGEFKGYSPMTFYGLSPGSYSMKATLSGYTPDSALVTVYAGQTATYYPVLSQSPQPRQTGTAYVTSNPNYASVYIDDNYYGKTPLTVNLYPGSHQVVLKLPGYNDYSTTVWVNAGQSQNLPVTMSTAVFGSFYLTSVPGAKVYMDSMQVGTTNSAGVFQQSGVTSGNHLFKVTAAGYNDWMNTVYLRANTVTTITATLTPIGVTPTPVVQQTGGLSIASSPSNAEVYTDNLFRGYTPLTVTDLSPGNHVVRLSEAGYMDYTTTTTVTAGQTAPLAATLSPAPTPTRTYSPAPAPALVIGVLATVLVIGIFMRRRY